jgi:hypothetical protein
MFGAHGDLTTEVPVAMLSLLRSSAPLALTLATLAIGSTGCAAKLGGSARLSLPSPHVTVHGYGNASGNAQAQFDPQAHAQAGGQWQSGGQAQTGGQWQSGGQAQAGGQWQSGGSCGPVAALPPAPPPPPRQPWRPAPVFYGVPLENAQDVVFVLDRSGSMTEADSGAPMGLVSPTVALSALNNAGTNALASFSIPSGGLPTSAAALGASSASAFAGLPGLAQGVLTSRQTKLDIAKAELTAAIAGLPDGTRYNVVFFGDTVSELSPSLVSLNPVTRIGSMVFVQNIAPDGMTAAVPALRTAYASNPHRVVFLSDGLANVDGDGQQLLAEARTQMRRGVRFDTVGVGADQDRPLMVALAQQSGGISTSR